MWWPTLGKNPRATIQPAPLKLRISLMFFLLVLSIATSIATSAVTSIDLAGAWSQTQELRAPAPASGSAFGNAVAASTRGLFVVGQYCAPYYKTTCAGAAHVFIRNPSGGLAYAQLLNASGDTTSGFAYAVAVGAGAGGAAAAVACEEMYDMYEGRCFVFQSPPPPAAPRFSLVQELLPDDPAPWAFYGETAAAGSGALAVGAFQEDGGLGAVELYAVGGGGGGGPWQLQQTLSPAGGSDDDIFGGALAFSGDGAALAIGAYQIGGDAGAVFLYRRAQNGTFALTARVGDPLGLPGALFGSAVALSGDGKMLLAGAPGAGNVSGGAFICGSGAAPCVALPAPPPLACMRCGFGSAVALSASGDVAAVSAPGAGGGGALAVFRAPPGGGSGPWTLEAQLAAPGGDGSVGAEDALGAWGALAMDAGGAVVVAGAPGWRNSTGRALVFERGTAPGAGGP